MADLHCQMEASQNQQQLTVGDIFHLICEGQWPEVKPETYELRVDQGDQYKIKLLGIQFESKEKAKISLTSYQVGDHQIKAVQLVSQDHSVVLGDLKFQVGSVIEPSDTPPEPYGPMGPLGLHFPLWFWIVLGILIVATLGTIGVRIRRRIQKKKLIEEMLDHDLAQSPYYHYHHVLRQTMRKHIVLSQPDQKIALQEAIGLLQELDQAYRLYLGRTLLIPTLKWNDSLILKEIQSDHGGLFDEMGVELKTLFAEYERAKKSPQNLFSKDVLQLVEISRKTVDHINSRQVKGGHL